MLDWDTVKEYQAKLKSHKAYPYVKAALKGILVYFIFYIIISETLYQLHDTGMSNLDFPLDRVAGILLPIMYLFFILNTVILTFAVYSRSNRLCFLEKYSSPTEEQLEQFDRFEFRQTLLQLASMTLCALLCPVDWFWFWMLQIPQLSFLTPFLTRVLWTALVFALGLYMTQFAAVDARKKWVELPSTLEGKQFWKSMQDKTSRSYSYWRMILRLVGYGLIYILLSPAVVAVIPILYTVLRVFLLITVQPWLLLLLFAFPIFEYAKALFRRAKFLRRLKKFAKKYGLGEVTVHHGFLSVLRDGREGVQFTLTVKKQTYCCRMLASVNRSNSITLKENGQCVRRFSFHVPMPTMVHGAFGQAMMVPQGSSMERELFHITSVSDYRFEAKGKKILILNPVPRKGYRMLEGEHPIPLDNGDAIGEYTVYSGNAFLRTLERDLT
jgi:hypothetical protein